MRPLTRAISQLLADSSTNPLRRSITNSSALKVLTSYRLLSTKSDSDSFESAWGDVGGTGNASGSFNDTELGSSWSTGFTKEHFNGEAVGRQINAGEAGAGTGQSQNANAKSTDQQEIQKRLNNENRWAKGFVDGWGERMKETKFLMKQVLEPGTRGSYLKDSEKTEMYKLHKQNPEVYTVEKLAKDYRIMRQRVHAILWLKEDEEEEEKRLGRPLDDSIEQLLDNFPEFFNSHDREFHVASLPYKPEFKVMPEGWDGTTKDPDEVHYEISMKEDEWLYQDFLRRFNFNKMKVAGEVKVHKYSRRRPAEGWNITVEKMGKRGKRGNGGGWKFVSMPDGSTRPLNEYEKMFLKRETPRRRRKILP